MMTHHNMLTIYPKDLFKACLLAMTLYANTSYDDNLSFMTDKLGKSALEPMKSFVIKQVIQWSLSLLINAIEHQIQPVQHGSKPSKQKTSVSAERIELVELKKKQPAPPKPVRPTIQPIRADQRLSDLDDILDKLAQQAESMKIIVILSFDIDQTMYYPSSDPIAQAFEQNVLDIFHQWLTTGSGSKRFILIPNTARQYADHWQQQMHHQLFPEPYAVIHSNGSKIGLSGNQPSWAPLFTANRDELLLAANLLHGTLAKHDDLARDHLISEYGDTAFAQLLYDVKSYAMGEEDGHVIAIPGAVSVFEGSEYNSFLWTLSFMEQSQGAHKYVHQQADARYCIYLDRSVNKGTALVFLLSELMPLLSEDSKYMLFTAGDDIYDLPMLFMNLLGQAFYPPSERNPDELADDLAELGISREELQSVQKIWQAGVLPTTQSEELAKALRMNGLSSSDRLLHAEKASLSSILQQIFQYLSRL